MESRNQDKKVAEALVNFTVGKKFEDLRKEESIEKVLLFIWRAFNFGRTRWGY